MTLAEYLRAGGALPFAWGSCDCCTWACGWVQQKRGVDPSSPWRGHYRSARGALREVCRSGGDFPTVVARAMAAAGLQETADPQPGDIGLVDTPSGRSLAIRTESGWAGKAERGIVVAPFAFLRAWSV